MTYSGNRILVVSSRTASSEDVIPATRSWRLAEALAKSQDVILAVPEISGRSHRSFAVVYYNRCNIGLIARDCDAVVCDAAVIRRYPSLASTGTPMAVDLNGDSPDARPGMLPTGEFRGALEAGDFFFCQDEQSRGLWLKELKRCGRINLFTQKHDPSLRRLIDLVNLPPGGKTGRNMAAAGAHLKPLDRFCASPRFAPDRSSDYNPAKMSSREEPGGLAYFLTWLRRCLKISGTPGAAARDSALIKRKISGEGKP